MIAEILKGNTVFIISQLVQISMVWIAVLLAILIDLFFGVKKAREIGEIRTSEGYRRSIHKFVYYYAMMSFALIFDFLDVVTPILLPFPLSITPVFSVLAAIALIFTEAKSVRENADDKARRRVDQSFKDMIRIATEQQDLMNYALDQFKQQKDKQNEETTNSDPDIPD